MTRRLGLFAEKAVFIGADVTQFWPFNFLVPDIAQVILDGRQPPDVTFRRLKRLSNIPVSWAEQRESLGFHR